MAYAIRWHVSDSVYEAIGPIESKRAEKVVSAVHLTGIGQAILASVGPSLLVDKAKE